MEERKREKVFFFFSSPSLPYLLVGWKHKITLRLVDGRVGRAQGVRSGTELTTGRQTDGQPVNCLLCRVQRVGGAGAYPGLNV